MSFGNNNRSFGPRSIKKRKQDFHKHKIHSGATGEQDSGFSALKERTILSLAHLGQQRFNQGPSGYSFENWMNTFNLLLDDFERSVGTQNLPNNYFEGKLEIASALANSRISDSAGLDEEIAKERAEFERLSAQINDTEIRNRARHDLMERKSKITSYEEEKAKLDKESQRIKLELFQKRKKIKDSSKILNRLLGATAKPEDRSSIERLESQLREAEVRIDLVTKKIEEQEERVRVTSLLGVDDRDHPVEGIPELRTKLGSVSANLEVLDSKKMDKMGLLQERIQATDRMRLIISNLEIRADNS